MTTNNYMSLTHEWDSRIYCKRCGQKKIVDNRIDHYDEGTGQPVCKGGLVCANHNCDGNPDFGKAGCW